MEEKQNTLRELEKELKMVEMDNLRLEKQHSTLQKEYEQMTKEVRKKSDANQLLNNKHQENLKLAAEIESKIRDLEEKCLESKSQAELKEDEYKI